jgi:NAD(P)-dependent dehydrogenase (short-subunit alcohol dehydrogenase family)
VAEAFEEIESKYGVPHVLVNNAGILGPLAPTIETDIASWWNTQVCLLHVKPDIAEI